MIDSVLKGTGNSRFLKSAVPAGTSWADALAMLQAGTFPIDFNGINTEGFQQVGTPLNKANLLKDATAAQIGLPPSTTPDGMFQALGNTGELHVWCKTTVTPAGTTTTYPVSTNPNAYREGSDAKPAGYTLGEVIKSTGAYGFFGMMGFAYGTSYFQKISDAIEVADDGSVSHVAPVDDISDSTVLDGASVFKERIAGKYITLSENSYTKQPYTNELPPTNAVLYIPADVNVKMIHPEDASSSNQYALFFDRYQPVTGYAAIPARTTIEYIGKLGDKARVQVVSYVGTGTYGSGNPNSLTFDFVPKMVMIRCDGDTNIFDAIYGMRQVATNLSTGDYVTVKWSKKTLSWYSDDGTWQQMNDPGDIYYAIAIC